MKGLPVHKKVYELLRKHINEGVYKEGDLLPSENELCSLHNATRPTIRKALDRLTMEGAIERRQGKGSIVCGKLKEVGILSISGTSSAMEDKNLVTKTIVRPEVRSWDCAFSFDISDLEREVGCIYFERLRFVDDKPAFYDITMIPNINLPRFTRKHPEIDSLFRLLREQYGIEVSGGEQKIVAVNADERLMGFFELKTNSPIIQLDRRIETNKSDFVFYSQVFCNAQHYSLSGRF